MGGAALLGSHLGGVRGLSLEWSLRVDKAGVSGRDRLTAWAASGDGFARVARALEGLGAPSSVLRAAEELAATSTRQGVCVPWGEGGEQRLYVQHLDPATGAERYDAWRWAGGPAVDTASYSFYFLPEAPDGTGPCDHVHPGLEGLARRLLADARLQSLSGFWLRRRGGDVDQVDLIYPWQPPLAELEGPLAEGAAALGFTSAWIDAHREDGLRHVALSGKAARAPSITLYFSAPAGDLWPDTFDAMRTQVRRRARVLREAMERRIFARLPPLSAPGASAVDEAALDRDEGEAFERSVRDFAAVIPPGDSVYEINCGWGGAAALLARERGCRVVGLTASRAQYRHCASRGLRVRYGDAEATLPPGQFGCVLMLDGLGRVRDKPRLLRVLRVFGQRLLLRERCQGGAAGATELCGMLNEAGWSVAAVRARPEEPTLIDVTAA